MSDYDDWKIRRDAARASWRAVNGVEEEEEAGVFDLMKPFLFALVGVLGVLAVCVAMGWI